MQTEELVEAARTAALGSYSPYSGFRVGAVVVGSDGQIFSAANVENAAYP
jgi:cytidine deaminase